MENSQLRKTEWRLTQYYRRKSAIGRFEKLLTKGRERMAQIEEDIRESRYSIDAIYPSVNYGALTKEKALPSSAIEKSLIKAYEQMENERCRLIEREAQLITTLARHRESVDIMDTALSVLDDEQRLSLELHYGQGCSFRQMEDVLKRCYSVISKRNSQLVQLVTQELTVFSGDILNQYDAETQEPA